MLAHSYRRSSITTNDVYLFNINDLFAHSLVLSNIAIQLLKFYLIIIIYLLRVGSLLGRFALQHINPFRVIQHRIKFQTIQFCISVVFVYKHLNAKTVQLNVKTLLFQTIQFRISTLFSSICPIDKTLSSATSPDQSELGSDGNEGVLCISQSSSITGTSKSNCLESHPVHSLGKSYPSTEKHSVYSTAPADWAIAHS